MQTGSALMMERADPPVAFDADERDFRRALGRFATGVTVVTIGGRGEVQPAGMTVNSFTSVSLSPKLVLVCIDIRAATLRMLRANQHFAINVLAAHQHELSKRFAGKSIAKFEGIDYGLSPGGNPVFDGCIGWFDCKLYRSVDAGDHVVVLGEVESYWHEGGEPLLYFGGGYRETVAKR